MKIFWRTSDSAKRFDDLAGKCPDAITKEGEFVGLDWDHPCVSPYAVKPNKKARPRTPVQLDSKGEGIDPETGVKIRVKTRPALPPEQAAEVARRLKICQEPCQDYEGMRDAMTVRCGRVTSSCGCRSLTSMCPKWLR